MLKQPNPNPRKPCIYLELGAQQWPVSALAPRQNRIVEPGVWKLMKELSIPMDPKMPKAKRDQYLLEHVDFKAEHYDLMVAVITAALQREHPTVTIDDILDMEGLTTPQMMGSLVAIAHQTGTLKPKEPEPEPPRPLD